MQKLLKNNKSEFIVKIYYSNKLSTGLCQRGLDFIRRRFFEEWDVVRTDVEYERILKRRNIVMFKEEVIIGWLGVEVDNEFTTACVDSSKDGVLILRDMIEFYVKTEALNEYFAFVPIEKTGSARAFLMSGWRINKPDCLIKNKYMEKTISLIKMVFNEKQKNSIDIEQEVAHIRRINDQLNNMENI
jgi:hypothetical protein